MQGKASFMTHTKGLVNYKELDTNNVIVSLLNVTTTAGKESGPGGRPSHGSPLLPI